MSAFQERVLNAPDVCSNCLRVIREERAVCESTDRKSVTSTSLSAYTRVRETTTVSHGPSETASASIGVFCECGVESAFERVFDDGEDRCLASHRVRELVKRAIRTLESKGVTLNRETFAKLAIQHYREKHDVNAALETGTETAIQTAAASGRSKTAPLSD